MRALEAGGEGWTDVEVELLTNQGLLCRWLSLAESIVARCLFLSTHP